jgi:type II secretory pathway component PulM
MKERWANLSLREKQTTTLGALGAAILLCYTLIWSPLSEKLDQLRHQIKSDQSLLSWMQESNKRIEALEKTAEHISHKTNGSLLGNIQTSVNNSTLAKQLVQLQQSENDTVQLHFQQVGFDNFIKWLIMLCQQQHLTVMQLTISPGDTPGVVDTELKLQIK